MRAAWSAVILCMTGACAVTDLVVLPPPLEAAVSPASGATERRVHLVLPFEHERPLPDRCGMKKNGMNMLSATIYCSQEPQRWLADALASELSRAGIQVFTAASSEWPGITIEGSLLQFFIEPKIGAILVDTEADIHIRLRARSRSGLEASRDFFVKSVDSGLAATDYSYSDASDEAAKKIVGEMVGAIVELLERYPDLGRAPGAPGPSI